MILNQQLNCNKMIKGIKVTSQRSPISDILHVFLENIFPRKHHLGIERPWAEWKKSLWKAISISPTSLHRILTSCQNWKQSFILHQLNLGNIWFDIIWALFEILADYFQVWLVTLNCRKCVNQNSIKTAFHPVRSRAFKSSFTFQICSF